MDPMSRDFKSLIIYNLETSGSVLTVNNQVQIYTDGQAKFEALRNALRQARRFIHIQYYIIKNDELFDSIVPILLDIEYEAIGRSTANPVKLTIVMINEFVRAGIKSPLFMIVI